MQKKHSSFRTLFHRFFICHPCSLCARKRVFPVENKENKWRLPLQSCLPSSFHLSSSRFKYISRTLSVSHQLIWWYQNALLLWSHVVFLSSIVWTFPDLFANLSINLRSDQSATCAIQNVCFIIVRRGTFCIFWSEFQSLYERRIIHTVKIRAGLGLVTIISTSWSPFQVRYDLSHSYAQ